MLTKGYQYKEEENFNTYASTKGPGYGSDFWYREAKITLKIIAGMNRSKMEPEDTQNPFCTEQNIHVRISDR